MKKYDIVAVVGTYTNQEGKEKKRYKNVGCIIDKGTGPFILLDRVFNPAGLPNPEFRDTVALSLFAPSEEKESDSKQESTSQELNDEIPF